MQLFKYVIHVNNINTFKNKWDKLWANENVKLNWRSDLTGSGTSEAIGKFILVSLFSLL